MSRPLAASLAVISLVTLTSSAAMAEAKRHVVLWNATSAARVTIRVNQVPVVQRTVGDTGSSGQLDVTEWIAPGENTLTLEVAPAAKTGKAKRDEDGFPIDYTVRLIPVATGEFPEEEATVAKVLWAELPKKQQKLPFTRTVTAKLAVPSSKLWSEAAKLTLDGNTRAELTKFALQVFETAKSGDAEAFYALNAFKLAERAAWEKPPTKEQFMKGLGEALPKLKFEPLTAKDLDFQLVANGSAVLIARKDGTAALSAGGFSMPLYAGKVDGRWLLVR